MPTPTEKPVTESDIVGTWQYPADYGKIKITLDLKINGTFSQTIKRPGRAELQIHTDTWTLDGAYPKLTVLKPVFGEPEEAWVLEDVNWWIVDSYQKGVTFAIFGAADDRDPDSCNEMNKIR